MPYPSQIIVTSETSMPSPTERFLGFNSESSEIGGDTSSAPPRSYRFGSELADAEFDNFFVVTGHYGEGYSVLSVYVIDVNNSSSSSWEPLDPILMLPLRRGYTAFVILDYKLYMFGGYTYAGHSSGSWNNFMSIFDLRKAKALKSKTTIDFTNRRVHRMQGGIHVNGPQMAAAKPWAHAVVIGQFRICVFSPLLYETPPNYTYGVCGVRRKPPFLYPNFELYDTRTATWIQLPEPFDFGKLKPKSWVMLHSYCVYGSSLYIRTTLRSRYAIDLDNPNPRWVNLDGCNFPLNGMWATPTPDITIFGQRNYPEGSTDRESLLDLCHHDVVGLGRFNNGCVNLCSVRAGLRFRENIPNLLIDIVKFDAVSLKKLGFDLSRWKEIQSDKSFTFSLPSSPCDNIQVLGLFPPKVLDTPGPMIKQLEDLGLESVAISNKVELESGLQWFCFPKGPMIKQLEDIGLESVGISNKSVQVELESGTQCFRFPASHTEKAKGCIRFGLLV